MWDLIVSVPDHCLSFYFAVKQNMLLFYAKSCVPTSKVYVPHFARLAVFVDRFLWDYNGKPLLKTDEKWINNNYNCGINDCRGCNLWQRKFGRVLEPLPLFSHVMTKPVFGGCD